jgi:ribonuclease P protein component
LDESLSFRARLRKKEDISAVYSRGLRCRGRYFHIVYLPGPLEHSRAAFVAARKVGGAVVRNKAKRRMRSLFRRNKNLLPAATDMVFVAKTSMASASWREIHADFLAMAGFMRKRARG